MGHFSNFGTAKTTRIVYAGAGIIFGLSTIPHLFPSLTQQEYQLNGGRVPEELQLHVENIATSMHIARPHRIKVFITKGLSSVSAGNTLLPYGAVVGLPRTVLYQDKSSLVSSGLMVRGEPIDLESHDGHMIAELLLPSIQQTNFTIAHELSHIQHLDFLPRSLLATVSLIAMYHLSCVLPSFVPIKHPVAVIPMTFAAGLLIYAHLHSSLCHWQEYGADRRAALCGRGYAKGGVDTMDKRIALDARTLPKKSSDVLMSGYSTHPTHEDRLNKLLMIHDKQKWQQRED